MNYESRITAQNAEISRLQNAGKTLRIQRFWAFGGCIVLLYLGWNGYPAVGYSLAGVAFAIFVWLVISQEKTEEFLRKSVCQSEFLKCQLHRQLRDWNSIPVVTVKVSKNRRGMATDLDLFGHGSLWQLLDLTFTANGRSTLTNWLVEPSDPVEVRHRQAAVSRLKDMVDYREKLALHGRMLGASQHGPADFTTWASGPCWLKPRRLLTWVTRMLSACMILVPILLLLGWLPAEWFALMFGLIAVHVGINVVWAAPIHEVFNQVTANKNDMLHYAALFQSVADLPPDCPRLAKLRERMSGAQRFDIALSKLQRIMRVANARRHTILGIPHLIAQVLFFLDFHTLSALESWQAQYGQKIQPWFEAVGQLEALCSLATLAHDHPDWAMPTVDAQLTAISAGDLGHPLLPHKQCVRNDISVGPQGTFLLVTGSNMSGKSTLLRSLGVNTTLALAGAPVCASSFTLPPLQLATSMRITDSLESGVSFFMAELNRLKEIVESARQRNNTDQPRLFYLLDEILQGTNTAERHIAVSRVIGHLLDCQTFGAVSTHDLELASANGLKDRCQLVHFREIIDTDDVGNESMRFDYKVRAGIASTTNALKLLRIVGLA